MADINKWQLKLYTILSKKNKHFLIYYENKKVYNDIYISSVNI